jgi:hypothetical protein
MATVTAQTDAEREAQHMKEREAQKKYWSEHSTEPTVEAMMLDSKASEIDRLERPEVKTVALTDVALQTDTSQQACSKRSHAQAVCARQQLQHTHDRMPCRLLSALTRL